jgi:hypothetical protein
VLITPNAANVDNPITLVDQAGRPMRMYTGDSWIDRVREA